MTIVRKRRISLEEEKKISNLIWKECFAECIEGRINLLKIYSAMSRLNYTDKRLIEMGRKDLL